MDESTDTLSALGRQLLRLGAAEGTYIKLVVDSPGNIAAKIVLESLSPRDLLEGEVISDQEAQALMSALWLRHDWLEESHRISQGIDSTTGSLWHAIMHRREGDFSNSKYWYSRANEHRSFATLAVRAGDVIYPFPADKSVFRISAQGWNPEAFVDLVEQVHENPADPRHKLVVMIQEMEWQVLFEDCRRAASGR